MIWQPPEATISSMMAAPGADGSAVQFWKTGSGTNSPPSMPTLAGSTPLTARAMSGPASATTSIGMRGITPCDLFRKGGQFVSIPVVLGSLFHITGSVLAFSADAEWLITFDNPFARRAAKLKLKPTVQAPWWRNP